MIMNYVISSYNSFVMSSGNFPGLAIIDEDLAITCWTVWVVARGNMNLVEQKNGIRKREVTFFHWLWEKTVAFFSKFHAVPTRATWLHSDKKADERFFPDLM